MKVSPFRSAASRRWASQNREADAAKRCMYCEEPGAVRHALEAFDGRYVWWTCWGHRWCNGTNCRFRGPGLPADGIPGDDYYRWFGFVELRDRTWLHLKHVLSEPLPVDTGGER